MTSLEVARLQALSEDECEALRAQAEPCRPCAPEDLYERPRIKGQRDDVRIFRCQRCHCRKVEATIDPLRYEMRAAPV